MYQEQCSLKPKHAEVTVYHHTNVYMMSIFCQCLYCTNTEKVFLLLEPHFLFWLMQSHTRCWVWAWSTLSKVYSVICASAWRTSVSLCAFSSDTHRLLQPDVSHKDSFLLTARLCLLIGALSWLSSTKTEVVENWSFWFSFEMFR